MIHFRVNVWSKSMLGVTSSKKSCMAVWVFVIIVDTLGIEPFLYSMNKTRKSVSIKEVFL